MAKKEKKTLGRMTKTRMTWEINPVTRVKPHKSKHVNRQKAKYLLRSGRWDELS